MTDHQDRLEINEGAPEQPPTFNEEQRENGNDNNNQNINNDNDIGIFDQIGVVGGVQAEVIIIVVIRNNV